ncbi:MAG: TonB-dependent receptor [Pseudomonadota bacterium]
MLIVCTFCQQALGQSADRQSVDIPSQPLARTLTAIGDQFGATIVAPGELTAGVVSPPIVGQLTVLGAVENALAASKLRVQRLDSGVILVEQRQNTQANNEASSTNTDSGGPTAREVSVPKVDEIIVKGELLDRTLRDSLTSAVVSSGLVLERRGEADLYDLIERTPGVGILGGESGFSIRGISQRGPGGGGGRTVSVTVDGEVVSNSNRATFLGSYSVWDMNQVEILRGPQSTQTGRNALAGAIVMRSNDPVYRTEGRIRLEAGSNDTMGAAFVFNAPIIEDKFAVRIAGQSLETDGEVENVTVGGNANERRDQTLRIGLRADFTDRFSAILKHTISDVDAGDDFVDVAQFESQDRKNTANFQTERINEKESTNLRLSYQFDPTFRLDWETTYYETDWSYLTDIDNSPIAGGTQLSAATVEAIQHEARLHFESERYIGVVGAYYTDVDENSVGVNAIPNSFLDALLGSLGFPGFPIGLPPGSVNTNGTNTLRTENYALFGEIEYQLTPQFDLTIGARYDWEENGTTNQRSENIYSPPNLEALLGFIGGPSGVTTSPDRLASFEAFLPKLALGYDVNDDLRVGFTVQRGYRAGGAATALGIGPYEFDPEYAWNYELALRSAWYDNRLTVNANAFFLDWTDQQVTQQNLGLAFVIQNAGESESYGMELDVRAKPTDTLELFTSFAYVKTEFTEYVVETAGAITDFTGNEFAGAPTITASAGITTYFPRGWYASVDASFTDEFFTGTANTETAGDYTLVNARVGFDWDSLSVFAYARNATDRFYQTAGGSIATPGARVGEGRIVGLVGQYSF